MTNPVFIQNYPSEQMMDAEQRSFYAKLKSGLNNVECIEVGENISYVFVYLYMLLDRWKQDEFEKLSYFILYISKSYGQKVLSQYCLYWAYDCLLAQKRYEEYIEKIESRKHSEPPPMLRIYG